MAPSSYNPSAPSEQLVPLPNALQIELSSGISLQPPLTRRGTGPGLIVFLPPEHAASEAAALDPPPVLKWAEEGFAVASITAPNASPESLNIAINGLLALPELDTRDKFALVVYEAAVLPIILSLISNDNRLVCLVIYGHPLPVDPAPPVPTLVFLPKDTDTAFGPNLTICKLDTSSPSFAFPQATDFNSSAASIAHSKAAAFIKKYLGVFDLEAIWEEHCYFEFEVRSVAQTMGTMVAEPYVNHVPTLTGGIGRKQLTAFYRDHFIFSNPADTALQTISRTVGSDRVVDEFIFHCTHDKQIDWLLPGVPPTGKKLAIPMLGVINIRGDRLYHEHIWWDQGTCLLQAGIIPTHVPFEGKTLRLPISGAESAQLLADERSVPANEMLGSKQLDRRNMNAAKLNLVLTTTIAPTNAHMPIQYYIPNLLELFSEYRKPLNPVFETADSRFQLWIDSADFLSKQHRQVWKKAELPLLAARIFPRADVQQLQTALEYLAMFLILEQLTDSPASSETAKKWGAVYLDALRPEAPVAAAEQGPAAAVLQRLRSSIISAVDPPYRAAYLQSNENLVEGIIQEALDREQPEKVSSIVTYLATRRKTIGSLPFHRLHLWIAGLQGLVYPPNLLAMVEEALNLAAVSNDLYSYRKEYREDGASHNFVTVAMRDSSTGLQNGDSAIPAAIEFTVNWLKDAHARLEQLKNSLLAHAEIDAYIEGMLDCVVGNIEWSVACKRYGLFEDEVALQSGLIEI
ncbi:hypothetical protein MKEN_00056300 [Mycena kentingensis (nom. inval.)]|nr:hypothetical protein MKEN_00056300 [Mycena kentingensis (nom. inval.)]